MRLKEREGFQLSGIFVGQILDAFVIQQFVRLNGGIRFHLMLFLIIKADLPRSHNSFFNAVKQMILASQILVVMTFNQKSRFNPLIKNIAKETVGQGVSFYFRHQAFQINRTRIP